MLFQMSYSAQDINLITLDIFITFKCFCCLEKLKQTFINESLSYISVVQLCQKFVVCVVVVVGVIEGNLLFFAQCCVSYRHKKAYFLPYIRRYATPKFLIFSITLINSSLRSEFVGGDNFVIFCIRQDGELRRSSPSVSFLEEGNLAGKMVAYCENKSLRKVCTIIYCAKGFCYLEVGEIEAPTEHYKIIRSPLLSEVIRKM